MEGSPVIAARIELIMVGDDIISPDYEGEADVNVTIRISNITAGDYYLVVASEGRWTYSEKYIEVPSGGELDLVKNFGYLHEFEKESW